MPAKRSRIRRSSSFGDTGVLDQLFPPVTEPLEHQLDVRTEPPRNAAKALKPSAVEEVAETLHQQSRPMILSVSSPPEIEKAGGETQIGNFMDKCHYCKKKIGENQEVFMYRSFGAFCSSECRDKAIEMDEAAVEKARRAT